MARNIGSGRRRCLFVQYTAEHGGSPTSGLSVVDTLLDLEMEVTVVFGVGGPMEEQYENRGCKIHHLPHGQWLNGGKLMRRAARWRWELKSTLQFIRLMKKQKIELVYVNTLMSVSAVIAARLLGIKSVWHIRELFQDANGEMHTPFGGRWMVNRLVRQMPTAIVFISKAVKENIIGQMTCRKSKIIYNPLQDSLFDVTVSRADAQKFFDLEKEMFTVGVPGNLRPVKGHEFFLDAVTGMLKADRDVQFIVSGNFDHDFGQKLLRRCQSSQISDRVHFLGAINDMRLFYAACNVVCVPSRGEPFGRTVIEAFAQKRPVIATRTGGILESVTERETGLLVDYGDTVALERSICLLKQDVRLRTRIAENASRMAKSRHHEAVFKKQMTTLIVENLQVQTAAA